MKEIYNYRHLLPRQTFKTLQGQVRAGDREGARRGLDKIIKRQKVIKNPLDGNPRGNKEIIFR